jgi:ABC-2 type transport system permease protein
VRNIYTIYRKELKSYFSSWIAYMLLAFFAIVFGWIFFTTVAYFARESMMMNMQGGGMPVDVNEWVIRPLLMNAGVIGLFIIPMITMRLFAEEKRTGTIELLMTSPVRDFEMIVAKWLAAVTLYASILGVSALNVAYLFEFGKPDWKPILVGYLGLLLQGGCLIAIGTFISSLTRNQIIAVGGTFAICLLLWVMDWVSAYDTAAWAKVVAYISVTTHFQAFAKGVLDTKDVVFYLSAIFFGLFLTARSMESLRWRA